MNYKAFVSGLMICNLLMLAVSILAIVAFGILKAKGESSAIREPVSDLKTLVPMYQKHENSNALRDLIISQESGILSLKLINETCFFVSIVALILSASSLGFSIAVTRAKP